MAAAIAGEDPALIGPLMESLEHDLLPRDDAAAGAFGVRLHSLRRRGRARAARLGALRGAGGAVRARHRLDRHRRPAGEGVGRRHGPGRFGDWVTIHRKVGGVDGGPLRPAPELEQTLCLRGAHLKVKWKVVEGGAAPARRVGGQAGPGSLAGIDRVHAARRTKPASGTRFEYTNEFKPPGGPLGADRRSRARRAALSQREAQRSLARLKAFLER